MKPLPSEFSSAISFYSYLGVGSGERKFLERFSAYRYKTIAIPKRRGGYRFLSVPEPRLRFLQRKTLKLLEAVYSPRLPVHGFTKGKNSISNASQHQTRPFLLNIDLKSYFPSITRRRVYGLLRSLGMIDEVASAICTICTTNNQLPQGAPTSPILANMVSFRLDRDLMNFSKMNRLRYTRYADDISFSCYVQPVSLFEQALPTPGRIPVAYLSSSLRSAIESNGFEINPDKVWFSGPKSRKEVTGLIVNEFTNVKRTFVRNIRASLHRIENVGVSTAQSEYQLRYKTNASMQQILRGRLEWLAQVRGRSFSAYRSLAKRYNAQFPSNPILVLPTYKEIIDRSVFVIDYAVGSGVDLHCVQGTAFFLEGVGLVTAYHILEDLPTAETACVYRPGDPVKYGAKPSARACPIRDLVILDHNIPEANHHSIPQTTSPEHTDDKITAVGFPSFGPGDQIGTRPGQIVGRSTKHSVKLFEVSAILGDGLSGAPILNDRNQVIGIGHKGGLSETKQIAVELSELLKLATE